MPPQPAQNKWPSRLGAGIRQGAVTDALCLGYPPLNRGAGIRQGAVTDDRLKLS